MHPVAILTPSFNRGSTLPRLYQSLVNQSCKDFVWLIVDDGSQDGTSMLVQNWIEQALLDIRYVYQCNGGKARALNAGFNYLNEVTLIVVVDSDDWLLSDAVQTFYDYLASYSEISDLGGFFFQYKDTGGHLLASKKTLDQPTLLNRYQFNKVYGKFDGCNCYHRRTFSQLRYPEFEGENYVGPTVLQLQMATEGLKMLFSPEVVGVADYQTGGLTSVGRKLRINNPMGMAAYNLLNLNRQNGLSMRVKSAVMGQAYLFLSGKNRQELSDYGFVRQDFGYWSLLPGMLLALFWKTRYYK